MIRFIRCFIWVLGTVVMVPNTCPAAHPCTYIFPHPAALKVGQRWTYLWIGETLDLNSEAILDTRTDTLTISVVGHRQVEDRTYFVLSYGSGDRPLYRVDDCRRTWGYDAEKGTEELCWDIWGLLDPSAEIVFAGNPYPFYDDPQFERWGPFDLLQFTPSGELALFSSYPDSTYGVPDQETWLENLLAWGATYWYQFTAGLGEEGSFMAIAPDVGLFLQTTGSWEYQASWTLLSYEPGDSEPISTSVEDVSFGEIKEQMRQRIKE